MPKRISGAKQKPPLSTLLGYKESSDALKSSTSSVPKSVIGVKTTKTYAEKMFEKYKESEKNASFRITKKPS